MLRGLLPVVVAAGAAVTCDNPTGPVRRMVALAIRPVVNIEMAAFAGMSVDKARLVVMQGEVDTIADQSFPFSPDADSITTGISVAVTDTATFNVTVQLWSGSTLMFTRTIPVFVRAGHASGPASAVDTLFFVGPGADIDSMRIAPRDSQVTLGGQLPFRISAWDSSGNPVSQFYVHWSTGSSTDHINADGLFRAGNTRGTVWVYAHTPSGSRDSTPLTVGTQSAGAPAALVKVAGDQQAGLTGAPIPILPAVKVTDANGTAVSGVTVNFAAASGGGSVSGGTQTTGASGIATVGGWTLGPNPGVNTLTATVQGLTPVTFTATAAQSGPAIVLSTPNGLVGVGSGGFLIVRLTQPAPAGGLTVTITSDSTQYVTVAGNGTVAFAAGDTNKVVTINGVAVGVSILHATATGYQSGITPVVCTPNFILLQQNVAVGVGQTATVGITIVPAAPSGGLGILIQTTDSTRVKVTTPTVTIPAGQTTGSATIQGVSSGIAVVSAAAVGYAVGGTVVTVGGTASLLTLVSGGNQSATPGSALPNPIVVRVSDSLGGGVSGKSVTFAVATGGGSVAPTSALSDVNGLASTTWTLGTATGAQTITASSPGLQGSPLTISANVTVASTTVTPKLDTLTALTATVQLAAQAKDPSGAPLTGSFTWLSRTSTVASVNPTTGRVTALANGSTWVVATEAGGTKDSALIVVQQKLASINVSPAARNIYLSTNVRFSASAVDGLGKPIAGISSFTWTTTAPAVATVDTAGRVGGVGLGTAQIRATSGTVTGVANVNVITVITRIAVVVDTVGATKTDTFSMPSLGLARRYRAIAHDTLDVVMSGIQFTWQSTNGSVAVVPNITADTVTATSAANGVTTINATAQGFTSSPGASLTVSQVLASIVLSAPASNPAATIAPKGTVALVARGKDANGRFISGGSFTYASATPAVATVDSTGRVTGVATGTSSLTAASGAITSNALTVTVSNSGPAIISFGRDTLSVGRGGTASIPILLSKPNAAALTVNLAATAFAHWSTASVVIPAGQTSVNATLAGDSAGTTTVTATDGSGLGYTAGGAVARVTANMRLASSGYAINATDIVTTQVLLSDPSPAGGTYVTFGYSTQGVARVSPDPAFIPAGQLAADIQILALSAGSTNITPSAIGVNGTASSFTAYQPVLTPSSSGVLLGVGQYEPNVYVSTPTSTNVPVVVALRSSDTTVATVTPSVTVPSGSYYAYFTMTAQGPGTATVTPSAPGWTAAHGVTVTTTTPDVGVCCSNNGLFTTSPQQTLTVYSEDSLRTAHYRVNSLVVHLRSTDTTVIKLLDTLVTIPPGQYYNSTGRFVMGGSGGTAYIVASASAHGPDSAQYTVGGAGLAFSFGSGTPRIGAGQLDGNYYVYTPNNVTSPLVVTLTSSDPTVLALPTSVTIPTGTYYAYFTASALKPGSVTVSATASGFGAASGSYLVTTPAIVASGTTTYNNFNPGSNLTIFAADSTGSTHYRNSPLVVSISSSDTTIVKVDSAAVTIDSGTYYNSRAHVTPVGVGTARLTFSAAGQIVLDSLTITVNTPAVRFSIGGATIGRRQHFDPNGNGFYLYTPDTRSVAVPLTLTQNRSVDTVTTLTPTIPAQTYYVYTDAFGLANGTDTLTVSASGYSTTSATITVTTPKFVNSSLPGTTTTTNPPLAVNVYAADSLGSLHYAMDSVVVHAVSSDTTVLKPAQPYFAILKNTYYTQATVNVVGPGTATITYSDSANSGYGPTTTNSVTVTAPPLAFSNTNLTLGMRQNTGASGIYVSTPNNVAAPLVVTFTSSDPRVASAPAADTIPAGLYYAYFTISGQDTTATVNITAHATGYTDATTTVRVTKPVFSINTTSAYTTSQKQGITIYAEDSATGGVHYTNEPVVVTLQSLSPGVATIDSATVTIPAGAYFVNTPTWLPNPVPTPGTAVLQASDPRSALYHYNTGSATVTVSEPALNFSWTTQSLGIGQYIDNEYVTTAVNTPAPISVGFTHAGAVRIATDSNGTKIPVTGVTIPAGTYYQYFRVVGTSAGTDTLVANASAPPHFPDTAYTQVGLGRTDPIGSWPTSLSLGGTDSVLVTLYARDPAQNQRYVQDSTTFTLAPNANIQFVSGGANSVVLTSVVIPANAYYIQFYVKGVTAGTGSATISATNYVTYNAPAITVTQ